MKISLLCPYRGGLLSHKTTPVQAHRGFRLLPLSSSLYEKNVKKVKKLVDKV
jgi:hypothetical protein